MTTRCSPQVLADALDQHRDDPDVIVEYDQRGKPAYIWVRDGRRTVGGWSYDMHLAAMGHPAVRHAADAAPAIKPAQFVWGAR